MGPRAVLAGGNYRITPGYGRQVGANLFHSFSQFNLQTGETATFSGPDSVRNIISRVTGGTASTLDGTLRSTIPGANFYLVNPAGVMFGPGASLDVGGSFTVTTADYLRLANGGRYDAKNPPDSVLVGAPVESFGFFGSERRAHRSGGGTAESQRRPRDCSRGRRYRNHQEEQSREPTHGSRGPRRSHQRQVGRRVFRFGLNVRRQPGSGGATSK